LRSFCFGGDHGGEQRGAEAEHHQADLPERHAAEQRCEPEQQVDAGLDHRGRVQIGRHRRGSDHRAREPEVERELRRLGERGEQQQHDGGRGRARGQYGLARGQDLRKRPRADRDRQQGDAGEQGEPTDGGGQKRAGGALLALAQTTDQEETRDAGQFPEHEQQQHVVCEHETQHGAGEQGQQ